MNLRLETSGLARREDLIWMKQLRSSPQDLVDIENLRKSHDQD